MPFDVQRRRPAGRRPLAAVKSVRRSDIFTFGACLSCSWLLSSFTPYRNRCYSVFRALCVARMNKRWKHGKEKRFTENSRDWIHRCHSGRTWHGTWTDPGRQIESATTEENWPGTPCGRSTNHHTPGHKCGPKGKRNRSRLRPSKLRASPWRIPQLSGCRRLV
jgi:hypothetical protein